jgi:hypothetical protein
MGHHDQMDPGHGEPGHVHDEQWNRHMMETDDPATSVEKDTSRDTGTDATYVTRTETVTYADDTTKRENEDDAAGTNR